MKAQCATRRVREQAIEIRQYLQSKRRSESSAKIQHRIDRVAKPRWFGLVKPRVIDREQAIKELDSINEGYRYRWASNYGSTDIQHMDELITACDMLLGKYGVGSAIILEQRDIKLFDWWFVVGQRESVKAFWMKQ